MPALGAGHNPLLPRPREVDYRTGALPLRGLSIRFGATPAPEDLFAARQLSLRLSEVSGVPVDARGNAGIGGPQSCCGAPARLAALPGKDRAARTRLPRILLHFRYPERGRSAGAIVGGLVLRGPNAGATHRRQRDFRRAARRRDPRLAGTRLPRFHDGPGARATAARRGNREADRSAGPGSRRTSTTSTRKPPSNSTVTPWSIRRGATRGTRSATSSNTRASGTSTSCRAWNSTATCTTFSAWSVSPIWPCRATAASSIPATRTSLAVIDDLVDQTTELFPSPWYHVGFDEPWALGKIGQAPGADPFKAYIDVLKHVASADPGAQQTPVVLGGHAERGANLLQASRADL